jgi:hypothetical protein
LSPCRLCDVPSAATPRRVVLAKELTPRAMAALMKSSGLSSH